MPLVGMFGGMSAMGLGMFPAGDFESIATVTVGSGGASSIEFTSIPGTYQHLQVRFVGRATASVNDAAVLSRLNSDSGSNYSRHGLVGDGSSASSGGASSQTSSVSGYINGANATASAFGVGIIDLLDYVNASKNTTIRVLSGADRNGSGEIRLNSSVWLDTDAVTSIALTLTDGNWAEHSTAALYGIKA